MASVKYIPYLMIAIGAALRGKLTFRLGAYDVSLIDVEGKPMKFTIGAASVAASAVLSGKTGTVQSGVIQISVTPR